MSWNDVENPTREDLDHLAKDYPFHPLNLDDCLSKRQLPKVDEYENHLYALFHIPVYDDKTRLVRKSQVSVFLGKDYVVSLHGDELKGLTNLFLNCMENEEIRAGDMKSSPRLLYHIMNVLVDDLYPVLSKVRSDLEDIEDKVFDQRASVAIELSRLRRVIADLRRIISPLRRLAVELPTKLQPYATEDLSKYFGDVHDHIEKAWEVLQEAEETIEIYMDTDFVLSQELTNKVLSILTLIFTFTIPVTVIGAIYGMNVLLPGGLQAGAPTFLGPFTSFIIIMGSTTVVAIGMVLYFHRKGWF